MMRLPNERSVLEVGDRVVHCVNGITVEETGTVIAVDIVEVFVRWHESGFVGAYRHSALRKVSGPCKPTL